MLAGGSVRMMQRGQLHPKSCIAAGDRGGSKGELQAEVTVHRRLRNDLHPAARFSVDVSAAKRHVGESVTSQVPFGRQHAPVGTTA